MWTGQYCVQLVNFLFDAIRTGGILGDHFPEKSFEHSFDSEHGIGRLDGGGEAQPFDHDSVGFGRGSVESGIDQAIFEQQPMAGAVGGSAFGFDTLEDLLEDVPDPGEIENPGTIRSGFLLHGLFQGIQREQGVGLGGTAAGLAFSKLADYVVVERSQ